MGAFEDELAKLRANGDERFWLDWATFWTEDLTAVEWLVEPLLPAGRSIAVYAKGGTGKSLLALWLAAGAATGRELFGAKRDPVSVLYLDYEMTAADLRERLGDMGYGPEVDMSHLHYALLPHIGPFDTEEGGNAIVARAASVDAALVVIDTFGRAVTGKENDADTLRAWSRWTGERLKDAGRALMRIDHAGKDAERGQRGTSAKNDDVDVVWNLTPLEGRRYRLSATKRRMSWVPETVELELVEDPTVGYRLLVGAATYPAGTSALADLLDDCDIPLDWGRPRTTKALREKGHGARYTTLAAAIKYRRERALKVFPRPDPDDDVETVPEQVDPISAPTWEGTCSGAPGNTEAERREQEGGVTNKEHPLFHAGPEPPPDDEPWRF